MTEETQTTTTTEELENLQTFELAFTLTVREINIILSALQELPHKVSRDVIDSIMRQGQPQLPVNDTQPPAND
jgi:hypothetical protein